MGLQEIFANNYVLRVLKIAFIMADSASPDGMPLNAAFIWVFAAYQRTPYRVRSIQRVNQPTASHELVRDSIPGMR